MLGVQYGLGLVPSLIVSVPDTAIGNAGGKLSLVPWTFGPIIMRILMLTERPDWGVDISSTIEVD